MNTRQIVTFLVLAGCVASAALSSDRYSIRSLGMGRTGVTATRGIDAISINPANLGMGTVGIVNINLLPLNARVGTELFTYDIYQKYFTGVDTGGEKRARYVLTDEDKRIIREQLPENGRTSAAVEILSLGFSLDLGAIGGFAFGVVDHVGWDFTLSRDFFDLFYLEGLPSNTTYDFSGTSFNAWWYREYNFSYGREIPLPVPFVKHLYGGIAYKAIHGYGIFETIENNSFLSNNTALSDDEVNTIQTRFQFTTRRAGIDFFQKTKSDSDKVKFKPFPEPIGKGSGFDIGVTAELMNGVLVGMSVVDIGKISWDKNIVEARSDSRVLIQGYKKDLGDTVKNAANGEEVDGRPFSTSLPTVLRIGASVESAKLPFLSFLPGRMLLAFEYAQGLNESMGNTTKPRFSLGMEYKIIPFVPLRTGIILGGGDNVRWAFGTGLDFRGLAIDLSTDNFAMIFTPNSFNVVSVGLGIKIRI